MVKNNQQLAKEIRTLFSCRTFADIRVGNNLSLHRFLFHRRITGEKATSRFAILFSCLSLSLNVESEARLFVVFSAYSCVYVVLCVKRINMYKKVMLRVPNILCYTSLNMIISSNLIVWSFVYSILFLSVKRQQKNRRINVLESIMYVVQETQLPLFSVLER